MNLGRDNQFIISYKIAKYENHTLNASFAKLPSIVLYFLSDSFNSQSLSILLQFDLFTLLLPAILHITDIRNIHHNSFSDYHVLSIKLV